MVQGLDRLKRKMRVTIPARVKANTEEALKRAARSITDAMESRAPEDSGRLRGSIGWTTGDAPKGGLSTGRTAGGRKNTGGQRKRRTIGDDDVVITIYAGDGGAYYARFVEFGTQNMRSIPFFYPSYRDYRKGIPGRVSRAIKKGLKEGSK